MLFRTTTLIAVLALLPACNDSYDDVREEQREATEATGDYLEAQYEDFVNNAETRLDELQADINKLEAEIESRGAAVAQKLRPTLEELREKSDEASIKLQEMMKGSKASWREFSGDVEDAMSDLSEDLADAWKEIDKGS